VRRTLALFVVLAATAAATVVPSVGSGAAIIYDLDIEVASPVEPLTFSATVVDASSTAVQAPLCDAVSIVSVEANGNAVTPLSETTDGSDTVVFTLPADTPPGQLAVEVECGDGEFPTLVEGDQEWGALTVTKVVDGAVPADATFVVRVTCDRLVMGSSYDGPGTAGILDQQVSDLPFGPTGGTKHVYFDGPSECVITEPVNGGATSTTIVPDEIDNEAPTAYATVVTNTFPAAVSPTFTG